MSAHLRLPFVSADSAACRGPIYQPAHFALAQAPVSVHDPLPRVDVQGLEVSRSDVLQLLQTLQLRVVRPNSFSRRA